MSLDRRNNVEVMREGISLSRLFVLLDALEKELSVNGCTMCGNCCHFDPPMTITDEEYERLSHHEHKNNESGTCPYLDGAKCSVYEDRPIECRLHNVFDSRVYDECDSRETAVMPDWALAIRELVYCALGRRRGTLKIQ